MRKVKKSSKDFSVQAITRGDYRYNVEYEIRGSRNCSKYGCDGICRCYKIDQIKITSAPNVYGVVQDWLNGKNKTTEIFSYCLERLARLCGMDNPDNFDAQVDGGYYGQEVGRVYFSQKTRLINKINQLMNSKTEKEKVEFVLCEEYGHILPKMSNLNYKVVEVNVNDVKFPNKEYLVKLNLDKVRQYEKELFDDAVVCLCVKDGNYYSLVDGYHRLCAWKNKGNAKIKIISAE